MKYYKMKFQNGISKESINIAQIYCLKVFFNELMMKIIWISIRIERFIWDLHLVSFWFFLLMALEFIVIL